MVDVEIGGSAVEFRFRGWHRLWALRSRLVVPRRCLAAVRRDPEYARRPAGWRLCGTYVPGLIAAGLYCGRAGREFWDVSRPDGALVVELRDFRYRRLVIEVDAPAETLRRQERAAA